MAVRRWWGWLVAAVGLMIACILVMLGFAVALDAGLLRGPALRYFAWRSGRTIEVKGALKLHFLTAHPWLRAEGVTLGNPPWTPPGPTADVERLELHFGWSGTRNAGIERLQLQGANLHLLRDTDGFANWQASRPRPGATPRLPVVRELQLNDVHMYLNDASRHLEFDGYVSGGTPEPDSHLALEARGILNSKPVTLSLKGDALKSATPDRPYGFEFKAASNGGRLSLKGSLPKPFETDLLDASFEASGADLRDLFFMTGLRLINTGEYHLTGKLLRRGASTRVADLALSSGQSDLEGSLAFEIKDHRRTLDAQLHSRVLKFADIGLRAAGRDPNASAPPPVFSDAKLSLSAARRMHLVARYAADRVLLGRFEALHVQAGLTLDRGILELSNLHGDLLEGAFESHARLDANQDAPPASLEFELTNAQLRSLPTRLDSPPFDGPFKFHAGISGRGRSLHEIVSTAQGVVSFSVVPGGSIRASLAELAGVDFRGLGLALSRSKSETVLRCAGGKFQAQDGTLNVERLVVDTEPVVITGSGQIHLGDEMLDLILRGQPKSARILRLAAPLAVRGSLRNPSITVQTHDAAFKLVDRGAGRDVDCHSMP